MIVELWDVFRGVCVVLLVLLFVVVKKFVIFGCFVIVCNGNVFEDLDVELFFFLLLVLKKFVIFRVVILVGFWVVFE